MKDEAALFAHRSDEMTPYDLIRTLSHTEVSTDRLEKFVDGTFHWKALTPGDQKAMARELLRWREHR